jgi:hypothetical protein
MLRPFNPGSKVRDQGKHLSRVWSRRDHAFLSAAKLRSRDHLHGLGDLLGLLDARYFSFNV